MGIIETIALLIALFNFVVVVAASVLYRRDSTIRALSQILKFRHCNKKILQKRFGDALQPHGLVLLTANQLGGELRDYQAKLALIGAVVVYEMEKCVQIRDAHEKREGDHCD